MGYIDPILEATLDNWVVALSILIFVFNYSFKRNEADLVYSSLVVMVVYIIGVFVLEYINYLPIETSHHYRYSIRLCLHAAGLLALLYISKLYVVGVYTKIVVACYSYNILMQLLLHIDRNVIGLNKLGLYFKEGIVIFNGTFDNGYWALWDWYTETLNVSAWLMLAYLLIGSEVNKVVLWTFKRSS